jgi:hypothetical protein
MKLTSYDLSTVCPYAIRFRFAPLLWIMHSCFVRQSRVDYDMKTE